MKALVVVRHGYEPWKMAYDALDKVFTDDCRAKRVLLKPNAGRKGKAQTAVCTNAEVIRGAIRFFKEKEAAEILVGDGALWGVNVWEAMEMAGITDMCREEGVVQVNLDEAKPLVKKIDGGLMVEELTFSSLPFEVDLVVSIPVIKTHMYTGATLSVKNMKGFLYKMEKTKLHRINRPCPDLSLGRCLDYGIADMASVLLPHYALLDGTVCMQGFGPSIGDPLNLDIVAASKDPTAADYVGVMLMGMKHDAIAHVNLVQQRCGTAGINDIEVDPADFMKYGKVFSTADMSRLANTFPNIKIIEKGTCSACSATLMAFVKTHGAKFGKDEQLVLATGKDLASEDLALDNLVLVGNCAGACSKDLPYCKGCPPVGSSILSFIRKESEDDYLSSIK